MKKILVLQGGPSEEYNISIQSATSCIQALKTLEMQVKPFTVTSNISQLISYINKKKPDIIFNMLHGNIGEDGTIQGILNWLKIPYTHSGRIASTILTDKPTMIAVCKSQNIPVANSQIFYHLSDITLPLPFVLKPCNGGSSIGVVCCFKKNDIPCIWPYPRGLAESYIAGKELTVTVLNGKSLTVTELISENRFYDFRAKYQSIKTHHKLPADIPDHIFQKVCAYSEQIWKMLSCRGMIRVDFRFNPEDNNLILLEGNAIPGMTEKSLAPEQAQACGISFPTLVNHLLSKATWDS